MSSPLNAYLDSVARSHIRLGSRTIPAQFLMGFIGTVAGTVTLESK